MKIVFLHGANATENSFNHISANIACAEKIFLSYQSADGFERNLTDMIDMLKNEGDLFLIAHSLGGVYALHLQSALGSRIKGVVSIATPFNGSESALILNLFRPCKLYSDITPFAKPISDGRNIEINCPWTAIITTAGASHLLNESNDGVVTEGSMRARSDIDQIDVDSGHYEILMRTETVEIIRCAINESFASM